MFKIPGLNDIKGLFNPEKEDGKKKPVRPRVVPKDVNDKYSEYPSEGLTPQKLATIYKEADSGDVKRQMELFEEIEEKDAHIASQLQTRKLAVQGLDWEIQAASENEFDKNVAEFVREQIENIFNQEDDVVLNILDAIGKGVSVSEIEWGVDGDGRNVISKIDYIPPKKLTWDAITDEMKICTREYPNGVSLPANKFVVHRYRARSGHTSKAGILRSVSWMYLFKNYDLKDWVTFAEVYGMPIRIGKYADGATEEDKVALMEALVNIGTDAAGIISSGSEIDLIEGNKTASAEIYEKLARYCDEQNSKAIVGQTLTADSGGGSYAQGKVHGDVRQDLVKADAVALAKTINRDIIRPLVLFNFGADADVPQIEFDTEENEDLITAAEVYRIVINDIGLPVAEEHLYSRFNIPRPETGEKLLQKPQQVSEVPNLSLKSLKTKQPIQEQSILDGMTRQAMSLSGKALEKMMKPLLELTKSSADLQELQLKLESPEQLKMLLKEMMDDAELEELMQQGIYLADAIGRTSDL